jgi:hypothetical protein
MVLLLCAARGTPSPASVWLLRAQESSGQETVRVYHTCGDFHLHRAGLKFHSSVMSLGKDSVLFLPVPKAMAMTVLTCKARPLSPFVHVTKPEWNGYASADDVHAIYATRSTKQHAVLCLRGCSCQCMEAEFKNLAQWENWGTAKSVFYTEFWLNSSEIWMTSTNFERTVLLFFFWKTSHLRPNLDDFLTLQ